MSTTKYERAFQAFSDTCQREGLTHVEAVIVAAQFAGLSVAQQQIPPVAQDAQLEVAAKAMRDSYSGRILGRAARKITRR